jgi:hypothetical protein
MKLGFICLDLQGHLNAMSALALELQAQSRGCLPLSSALRATVCRGPEKDHINESLPEVSKKQGEDAP